MTETVVCGRAPPADVYPERWSLDRKGRPSMTVEGRTARLELVGSHQVDNAMLAIAVGRALDVSVADALAALAAVPALNGRAQVRVLQSFEILDDCYNANPDSLRVALETFDAMRGARRGVVVVGTMLELGAQTAAWHERAARDIVSVRPDVIAAVGAFADAFETIRSEIPGELITAPDAAALGPRLAELLRGGEFMLLKASRSVALEHILDYLPS